MKRKPGARDGSGGRDERERVAPGAGVYAPLPASAAAAERAALALGATLAVLALARGALGIAPSMWIWGANVLAFVAPVPGWALWAASAAALTPSVARRLVPALARAGDVITARPALAGLALGAVLAITVLLEPDRLQLVGDYLLRAGTAREQIPAGEVFPQALPLDLAIHYTMPGGLARALGGDPNDVSRAIGAIEAAWFGILAVAFARALRISGAAAAAAACVVAFGGALGMFTGFAKAFGELSLVTVAFGTLGVTVVREGRGLLALSIAVCAGLLLHRSALAFLPPLALVWGLWFRRHARGGAWRRPLVVAALALPPLTLGLMLPRIRAAIASTDRSHFARAGSDLPQVLGAAFGGSHLADLGNLLLVLSPIALAAPALALVLGRSPWRKEEALVLTALLLPFAGLLLFVHPRQGPFRDWDVFTAAGVAVSLFTAWLVAEALRASRRGPWLAPAVVLGALAPALHWLMHNHDLSRGLARVEAYVAGPPQRGADERALLSNFLGLRYVQLHRRDEAAEALARAAELAPSPRILSEWAMAEMNRGRLADAQRILQRLVERAPDRLDGWAQLARLSYQMGDTAECRRAAEAALRIRPGLPQARDLLERLAGAGERR